ncbi:MAG: RNA-binding S4 domain-containing protein [Planctomycetaceae bacterium]
MSDPSDDSIRLDQFLKLASCVSTGGEAKQLIQSGEVTVNGAVETRRRRKLVPGDRIVCRGEEIHVLSDRDEPPSS